ncbi:hypothetical protein [uncultured Nitratireductor sp.]|uniref:hypothetical protein n=1 Tax=uncultured Nitratireductor sp. TaxID=520953 RepID=UPI0025D466F2|nr:hypothetical protein [uncultured Nitratireductor sp.]
MSDSVENARRFLENLQRPDLSKLLAFSEVDTDVGEWFDTIVTIRSPKPFADAIAALPPHDRKRIAEAVVSNEGDTTAPSDITCRTLPGHTIDGAQALLPELIVHQQTMIDVGTGNASIQDVNDYYLARERRIAVLCSANGVPYENPHDDLWSWFRYYKQHFGTYAERRQYIRELFKPAIKAVSGRTFATIPEREPTGWERVDRGLAKARSDLEVAAAEEAWQAIGLLCREVIISLAQAVHDPEVHLTTDEHGTLISRTDARRLLDAWLHYEHTGGNNKEIRAHIKASLDLAVNLQHRRTATRQMAALCLEATSSAVAVVAILAGRWEE